MNDLLDKLDKYKYGLFVMVGLFMVVSMIRIQTGFVRRPDLSDILNTKPNDLIELKLEPVEIVEQRMMATGEVKNSVNDENSSGSASNSSSNNSPSQGASSHKSLQAAEQSVYDLEKSLYAESGGAEARAAIQRDMDQRKKEQEEQNKKKAEAAAASGGQKTAGNSSKGNVLVSYNLTNRNGVSVPAPGYMCPQGTSGKVIINVRVDNTGKVIDAKVNPSSAQDECMTSYALKFALKSKFNYDSNAGSQDGTITYTFVN